MITSTSNISPIMTDSNDIDPNTYPFPPVIRIYSFLPDPENKIIPVQPLGPEHDDDTTARPILVAQLDLPRLAAGAGISSFDVRPDPAFPRSSTRGVGERKAFTQDPEKGVLVFELSLNEPADAEFELAQHLDQKNFELFVLRETLVALAKEGEERLVEQRGCRDEDTGEYAFWKVERNIPWAEWGEKQSRFMDMSMSRRVWVSGDDSATWRHGSRVIRYTQRRPLTTGLFVLGLQIHHPRPMCRIRRDGSAARPHHVCAPQVRFPSLGLFTLEPSETALVRCG